MNTKYLSIINIYNSENHICFCVWFTWVSISFNLHHLPCLAPRLRTDSELTEDYPSTVFAVLESFSSGYIGCFKWEILPSRCCYIMKTFSLFCLHLSLAAGAEISIFNYPEDLFEAVGVTMICGPIKMTFADDMIRRVVSVHLSMKTRWSFHRGHTGDLVTCSSNVISSTAVASICISAAPRWTDFLTQSHVKGK